MRTLLLGARGAVGSVIRRELEHRGHRVTAAGRSAPGGAAIDLHAGLAPLARAAAGHDVVVNASGVERPEVAEAVGPTPLVEISATGSYLDRLRGRARGPVLLGAGLVPGLSTLLVSALDSRPGDDVDVLVMLGTGERHGPAAVAWTAGLVGAEIHRPPEGAPIRNFRQGVREVGPDGRSRRYLRADFPDHVLLGPSRDVAIRSYLTLGSAAMTAALGGIARVPALRGALARSPHLGSEAWHVVARNRRTGERREATGSGQSEATGRLTALAAVRVVERPGRGVATMADVVGLDEALDCLRPLPAPAADTGEG
ncbi:hypothetical protein NBM05_06000 [Rothia sp. AR01]|uniref:Saccharopine dehydrogenase n=1 Tax=Rothia santali TaxID=2949643 RepID=A0A9X2HD89_9MICC|nr:hypothetical protein [Rothia santali]MCP3425577.1 hypothetical protein [Rothia santali]